jgi:hypothetical protein
VDNILIGSTLGQQFVDNYAVLPADGTRGNHHRLLLGSLLTDASWHQSFLSHGADQKKSGQCHLVTDMSLWSTKRGRQELFHARTETNQINHNERWLLVGDFNLIYRANDKSSGPINRRLLTSFKSLLVDLEVKEIHLHGRCYTWSSGTANPTQTKIDHVFATRDWEMLYPDYHLQTGGIEVSDHCPMVLSYSPFSQEVQRISIWGMLVTHAGLQRKSGTILVSVGVIHKQSSCDTSQVVKISQSS